MIKKLLGVILTSFSFCQTILVASSTATATITYSVGSIDSISISGNPGALIINSAVAGSEPATAQDSSTTYAITTNNSSRLVTGALSTAMPEGLALSINLNPASGATSLGKVPLSTTPATLITDISQVAQASLAVTYFLDATVAATQETGGTNIVTFTISP